MTCALRLRGLLDFHLAALAIEPGGLTLCSVDGDLARSHSASTIPSGKTTNFAQEPINTGWASIVFYVEELNLAGSGITSAQELMVPTLNLGVSRLLFAVEVGLRELIIESLELSAGPQWYKQRVPGPIYQSSLKRLREERASRWTTIVNHHPIYYTNFAELKVIIERNDNWRDVFEPIFKDKVVLVGTLQELDPVRNKIAHNRRATEIDAQIAETALAKLTTSIGGERFRAILLRSSETPSIREHLRTLLRETEQCQSAIDEFRCPTGCPVWSSTQRAWWFDDDYLEMDLAPLHVFFNLVLEYEALPRSRGTGHKLEQWFDQSGFDEKAAAAITTLQKLV